MRIPNSNDAVNDFLMTKIPKLNKIEPKFVHAGQSSTDKELALGLKEAVIHVLAPEKDIDHYYLGEEADSNLKGMMGGIAAFGKEAPVINEPSARPKNISASDFRTLQSRLLSNGLAFAEKDSSIQNNLSVVLLIEWRGRRLLFVGDAEWDGEFRVGKNNGSWNVMWEKWHDKHLKTPVDFLKIGHHGSVNATPAPDSVSARSQRKDGPSVNQILDTLLPLPKAGKKPTAKAVASTEREFYKPIPKCKLLVELAKRVSNTRDYGKELVQRKIDPETLWQTEKAKKNLYFEECEGPFLGQMQPWRTDLEEVLKKSDKVPENERGYVDVEIPAGD